MVNRIVFVVALSVSVLLPGCIPFANLCMAQARDSAELQRQIQDELDAVIFPAIKNADEALFFERFGQLISGQRVEVIQAVEEYAKKSGVGSPLKHFIDLQLKRVEQGLDSADGAFTPAETIMLVQGINRRIETFFSDLEAHPFLADEIMVPSDWKESRDVFWGSHVLKNEFANSGKMLEFGNNLLARISNQIKKLSPEQLAVITEFENNWNRFPQLRYELSEGEAVAHLIRFQRSVEQLETAKDFRQQLVAAMNVHVDGKALIEFFDSMPGNKIKRRELIRPNLRGEINATLDQLISTNTALMQKAKWFRSGAHWWLRGRYGRGALANGLLKIPEAVYSISAMEALYMPKERPVPSDNFIGAAKQPRQSNIQPHYKRRHYYTWALEYRPIQGNSSDYRVTLASGISTRRDNVDFFY